MISLFKENFVFVHKIEDAELREDHEIVYQ